MSHTERAGRHVLTDVATLNRVIAAHAGELRDDLIGYRNHAYRVLNLCVALGTADADTERIVVAAAYHDLGVWTHGTFDYLQPSAGLAAAHLRAEGKEECIPEVTEMIRQHHKVTRHRHGVHALVEPSASGTSSAQHVHGRVFSASPLPVLCEDVVPRLRRRMAGEAALGVIALRR